MPSCEGATGPVEVTVALVENMCLRSILRVRFEQHVKVNVPSCNNEPNPSCNSESPLNSDLHTINLLAGKRKFYAFFL